MTVVSALPDRVVVSDRAPVSAAVVPSGGQDVLVLSAALTRSRAITYVWTLFPGASMADVEALVARELPESSNFDPDGFLTGPLPVTDRRHRVTDSAPHVRAVIAAWLRVRRRSMAIGAVPVLVGLALVAGAAVTMDATRDPHPFTDPGFETVLAGVDMNCHPHSAYTAWCAQPNGTVLAGSASVGPGRTTWLLAADHRWVEVTMLADAATARRYVKDATPTERTGTGEVSVVRQGRWVFAGTDAALIEGLRQSAAEHAGQD